MNRTRTHRVSLAVVLLSSMLWISPAPAMADAGDETPPAAETPPPGDEAPPEGDGAPEAKARNEAPVANDDRATVEEDRRVKIAVLDNDADPEGETLTLSSTTNGTHGNTSFVGDTVRYEPHTDYFGRDSFEYTVCDAEGACSTASVSVEVTPLNDRPNGHRDVAQTDEDTTVRIDVLANDRDVDGDALVIKKVTQGNNGSTYVDNAGTADPGDDTVVYTPDSKFSGRDRFRYRLCDPSETCKWVRIDVTVIEVQDPPDAVDDSTTTNEDVAMLIEVLANDSDGDGPIDPNTLTVTSGPTNGTTSADSTGVTYTPADDFNGSDSFTYEICDSTGACSTANVDVTVVPVNDPPVALDDKTRTDEDTPVSIDVMANDSDPDGDAIFLDRIGSVAHGSAFIDDKGTADPTDDVIVYTPPADFHGTDAIHYSLCDVNRNCAGATVGIRVVPVNDPPVPVDDSASTDEDVAVTVNVVVNDDDVDDGIDATSVSVTTPPAHGTTSVDGTTGEIMYTPHANYHGGDSLVYEVCDQAGDCATANVQITIDSMPDAPDAVDDADTTDEDTPVTITVRDNDSDADGNTLTVSSATDPANGSVVTDGSTVAYTPDADFNGTDTFDYEICDGTGLCDTATVTVTVAAVNDSPTAVDDLAANDPGKPVEIDATANDSDPDGDVLTIVGVTSPAEGDVTITAGNTIIYTPAAGSVGDVTFGYTACDPSGACADATVTVTVKTLSTISGVVWGDDNGNGRHDGGESQLSNVRVELTGAGDDGVLGTADDVALGDAYTGSPYSFTGLAAGTYRVTIDGATLPTGYTTAAVTATDITLGWGEALLTADFAALATDDQSGSSGEDETLPLTGADTGLFAFIGTLLTAAGVMLLSAGRRGTHPAEQ